MSLVFVFVCVCVIVCTVHHHNIIVFSWSWSWWWWWSIPWSNEMRLYIEKQNITKNKNEYLKSNKLKKSLMRLLLVLLFRVFANFCFYYFFLILTKFIEKTKTKNRSLCGLCAFFFIYLFSLVSNCFIPFFCFCFLFIVLYRL